MDPNSNNFSNFPNDSQSFWPSQDPQSTQNMQTNMQGLDPQQQMQLQAKTKGAQLADALARAKEKGARLAAVCKSSRKIAGE